MEYTSGDLREKYNITALITGAGTAAHSQALITIAAKRFGPHAGVSAERGPAPARSSICQAQTGRQRDSHGGK